MSRLHPSLADLPRKYQDQAASQLYPKGSGKAVPVPAKARIRQRAGSGMNKLESAFLGHLKGAFSPAEIRYNAVSFELANGLRYKPDFTVGIKYAYEVKGPWASRDAFPRLKMAARLYPEIQWFLVTREGRSWNLQTIQP